MSDVRAGGKLYGGCRTCGAWCFYATRGPGNRMVCSKCGHDTAGVHVGDPRTLTSGPEPAADPADGARDLLTGTVPPTAEIGKAYADGHAAARRTTTTPPVRGADLL